MIFSSRRTDLFTVTPYNQLHRQWLSQGDHGEGHLFPGASAAGLALAALVQPFSPLAAATGVGLLVSVDGALGLGGATFTWLYDTFPPFRAFRAPGRFSAVAGLFVCILAGLGLHRLLGRDPTRGKRILAAGLIGFAVFELQVDLKLLPVPMTAPAIYGALPDDDRAVIINLPVPSIYNGLDFQYIYHSTFHHRRMINGSSGFIPSDYANVVLASERFPDDSSMEILRNHDADFAVLHADYYDEAHFARIVEALALRPDVALVAERPSPGGRVDRLYRLR
jgi:hypothetical protein